MSLNYRLDSDIAVVNAILLSKQCTLKLKSIVYFIMFTNPVIFISILLTFLIRVHSEATLNEGEIDCKKPKFFACEATDLLLLFPSNKENFEEICRFVYLIFDQHFSCLKKFAMTCEHPVKYGGNIRYYGTYAESICSDDSPVSNVIRATIDCIEKAYTFKDTACAIQSEELTAALTSFRENDFYDYDIEKMSLDEFWDIANGLVHLHNIGCFLRLTEECGKNVRKSLTEFLRRIGHFEFSTPNFYVREKRAKAEELLENLDLEDSLKNIIKEMLALQQFY